MKFAAAASIVLLLAGCGSSDKSSPSGQCGDGAACRASGGATGAGGAAAGGAGTGGASSDAAPGASGGSGPSELTAVCSQAGGTRLAGGQGPCFKACTFNGADPPFYDAQGDCTRLGYQCGITHYCNPAIKCTTDAACVKYGGPGWLCAKNGPLVGQCLIACQSVADCPASATTTPYQCTDVYDIKACN